jgi:uncharacterized glyoxalase superfamily protein PhnB
MALINPYINFNGTEDAFHFLNQFFGGVHNGPAFQRHGQ